MAISKFIKNDTNAVHLLICILAFIIHPQLYSQVIPFSSDRWEIDAKEFRIVKYKDKESLFLKGGIAYLKDVDFLNGSIEFDLALPNDRGFMGAVWRLQNAENYEEFYLRPHQSGNPDANQYTPVFNGLASWQLYHGDGYGAPISYEFNEWIHVKIIIKEDKGEVFINDMAKPALVIHKLKHKIIAGKIGVEVCNFAPARFSNFKYSNSDQTTLKRSNEMETVENNNIISSWEISNPFNEKVLNGKNKLDSFDKKGLDLEWNRLQSESSGLVNIARITKISEGNTVFTRVTR